MHSNITKTQIVRAVDNIEDYRNLCCTSKWFHNFYISVEGQEIGKKLEEKFAREMTKAFFGRNLLTGSETSYHNWVGRGTCATAYIALRQNIYSRTGGKYCVHANDLHLQTLPPIVSKLHLLRELNLTGNKFDKIPSPIFELTNLRQLWLSGNKLKCVSGEIKKLTNLITLVLGMNEIKDLPPEIGNLTKLETLKLNNNQLTKLPKEMRNLSSLRRLNIMFNHITNLQGWIFELRPLELHI